MDCKDCKNKTRISPTNSDVSYWEVRETVDEVMQRIQETEEGE